MLIVVSRLLRQLTEVTAVCPGRLMDLSVKIKYSTLAGIDTNNLISTLLDEINESDGNSLVIVK